MSDSFWFIRYLSEESDIIGLSFLFVVDGSGKLHHS